MAVSVVNGYVCTSSCDVAKAKKGEDPHPAIHAANGEPQDGGVDRGPAVLFGGSLSGARGAEGVQPPDASATSDPANGWTRKLGVDRHVFRQQDSESLCHMPLAWISQTRRRGYSMLSGRLNNRCRIFPDARLGLAIRAK